MGSNPILQLSNSMILYNLLNIQDFYFPHLCNENFNFLKFVMTLPRINCLPLATDLWFGLGSQPSSPLPMCVWWGWCPRSTGPELSHLAFSVLPARVSDPWTSTRAKKLNSWALVLNSWERRLPHFYWIWIWKEKSPGVAAGSRLFGELFGKASQLWTSRAEKQKPGPLCIKWPLDQAIPETNAFLYTICYVSQHSNFWFHPVWSGVLSFVLKIHWLERGYNANYRL